MDWLSKLIVVDNLGCPKCKQNSTEFLEKKNLPSNKEDMLGSFNIDRVVQSDCYKNTCLLVFKKTGWEAYPRPIKGV